MKRSFGAAGASVASIGAAFLASLCCAGPLLFVTLGVGAGLASRFEPLRPVFTVLSVGLLALGFYAVYGRRSAVPAAATCSAESVYTSSRGRRRDTVLLWGAALVAFVLLTFPQWSRLLV